MASVLYSTQKKVILASPSLMLGRGSLLPQQGGLKKKENRRLQGGMRLDGKLKKSEGNMPLISIVTVVYNGEKYLEEAILSVLNQDYSNVEYIVIDGGSTDNSLDIIKSYDAGIDYWVSESDGGIWDAMNKGISLSTGEVVGILNSDDYYNSNALSLIAELFASGCDYVFGAVQVENSIRYGLKTWKLWYTFDCHSKHSSGFFVKKYLHDKLGLYDTSYNSADFDFFYKLFSSTYKGGATTSDQITGNFRLGGFSSKISPLEILLEQVLIRYRNGQNKYLLLIIFVVRYLKHFWRI